MSVVLLYNGKRVSAMAADSRIKAEGCSHTDSVRKTFSIHGGLLGVAGDAGMITEVRRVIWEEPNVALITKWPRGEYQALYLNAEHKLYEIDSGQIIPHDNVTLLPIGVGGEVALGAAEAWFRLNKIRRRDSLAPDKAKAMLKFSLACAIAHHSDCGGRIMLRYCDLSQL